VFIPDLDLIQDLFHHLRLRTRERREAEKKQFPQNDEEEIKAHGKQSDLDNKNDR
jgi:hypothetical protein